MIFYVPYLIASLAISLARLISVRSGALTTVVSDSISVLPQASVFVCVDSFTSGIIIRQV